MRKTAISFILLAIICSGSITLQATKYRNVPPNQLQGRIITDTTYNRLPQSLLQTTRSKIAHLGTNSAGLYYRFRSNSTKITLRWRVQHNNTMNHMTPTGIKGLDLYCWENTHWQFVNSARPTGKENESTVIESMNSKEREFMLFLPLYDGIESLQIGIDDNATLEQPSLNIPQRQRPIVCYGTSILQGGCATRPGMAHTNILVRRLNRELINLGFSGNALLDYDIAHFMAQADASMYILDFVPNANVTQMKERMEEFYSIIRRAHPTTPILFVEDPLFPTSMYSNNMAHEIRAKNEELLRIYNKLKKQGEKNIYFLSSKKIIGTDNEATVDGIHFTDLGFMRYADILYPIIKKRAK